MKPQRSTPEKILKELGIIMPEEIDIEAIAQYCGATIIPQKLYGSAARIIGVNNHAFITIDSQTHRSRQRFSAAHELGHWMLDRGKIANFICTEKNFINDWSFDNPERRANRFAADLLLPRFIFEPLAKNKEITFSTVLDLCKQFETSLTATAIRLVELGSFPAIVVCNDIMGKLWQFRGTDVPYLLQVKDTPGFHTNAYKLLNGNKPDIENETQASDWITHPASKYYSIYEDSKKINNDLVLSILWWKDEKQLLDLEDEEHNTN